ncbi:unnamed protein product, partial [Dovyalis caffra]
MAGANFLSGMGMENLIGLATTLDSIMTHDKNVNYATPISIRPSTVHNNNISPLRLLRYGVFTQGQHTMSHYTLPASTLANLTRVLTNFELAM